MSPTKDAEQKVNGVDKTAQQAAQQMQRVVSDPNDVASVVLMQVDQVNAKKDDFTIAIKGLGDLTKQLVRAYAENMEDAATYRNHFAPEKPRLSSDNGFIGGDNLYHSTG